MLSKASNSSINCCDRRRSKRKRRVPQGARQPFEFGYVFSRLVLVLALLSCLLDLDKKFVVASEVAPSSSSAEKQESFSGDLERFLQSSNITSGDAMPPLPSTGTTDNATATDTVSTPVPAPVPVSTPSPTEYNFFPPVLSHPEDNNNNPSGGSGSSLDPEFPSSVDIEECRKHLQVVDTDRNNLMTEDEYVKFVQQIVTHDFNHSLVNLPETSRAAWGNTLQELPPAIQANYDNLNKGGVIDIKGYKNGQILETEVAHQMFLAQVCLHTEIAVYRVLQEQSSASAGGDTQQASSATIPDLKPLTAYSSFTLSNQFGISSENLESGASTNRQELELAYQILVTKVVGKKVGMALTPPGATGVSGKSPGTSTKQEATRGRRNRFLMIAVDPQLPKIYRFDDRPCPGASENLTASVQKEWCQIGYGTFVLYLLAEKDSLARYNEYSEAVQTATANGELQQILQEVTSGAVDIVVTGAGPSILPPPDTAAPTPPPHPAPTSSPQNMTVPPEGSEGAHKKTNMQLIYILAGVLGTVNFCIISISIFFCWRNKNKPDLIWDEEGVDAVEKEYLKEKRMSKKRKKNERSKRSLEPSLYEDDDEMVSNPPTLEEIAEANSMPAPAPAPAPIPLYHGNMFERDAQERERILKGQGSSSHSTSSAPTREEIESKLTGATTTSSGSPPVTLPSDGVGESTPLSPVSENNAGYQEEDDLPVKAGEMA